MRHHLDEDTSVALLHPVFVNGNGRAIGRGIDGECTALLHAQPSEIEQFIRETVTVAHCLARFRGLDKFSPDFGNCGLGIESILLRTWWILSQTEILLEPVPHVGVANVILREN